MTQRSFKHSTATLVVGRQKWAKKAKTRRLSALTTGYLSIKKAILNWKSPPRHFNVLWTLFVTVKWQYKLVYLDDVNEFSHTPSQHIWQVATVLRFMKSAVRTMKLKKSFFIAVAINCFEQNIRSAALEVAMKPADAISCFNSLTNIGEVRSLLSLCNGYRRLGPRVSNTAAPLIVKLKKGKQ